MRSVDGDRDGANGGESGHQFGFIATGDINETVVDSSLVLGVVAASVILSLVGIGVLSVDALVVLDVLEGLVHQTAVAAFIAVLAAAIDQVLFAQRHQLASLAEVLTLQSTSL